MKRDYKYAILLTVNHDKCLLLKGTIEKADEKYISLSSTIFKIKKKLDTIILDDKTDPINKLFQGIIYTNNYFKNFINYIDTDLEKELNEFEEKYIFIDCNDRLKIFDTEEEARVYFYLNNF